MADTLVDKKALIEGERPMFQASYGKLMMWFFLVSDAFTFSALLLAYGALRVRQVNDGFSWANPEDVFTHTPILHEVFHIDSPLVFVGLMTFVLILSSVAMVLAVEAGHRKSRKEVKKWVAWTLVGGVAFLGCQAYEWYHFISGTPEGGIMVSAEKLKSMGDRKSVV
jgi:cytochrome c oxidase subunit III